MYIIGLEKGVPSSESFTWLRLYTSYEIYVIGLTQMIISWYYAYSHESHSVIIIVGMRVCARVCLYGHAYKYIHIYKYTLLYIHLYMLHDFGYPDQCYVNSSQSAF